MMYARRIRVFLRPVRLIGPLALGIKACQQGVRTLFITATALITTLGRALAEGRLEERLKVLTQPQLADRR